MTNGGEAVWKLGDKPLTEYADILPGRVKEELLPQVGVHDASTFNAKRELQCPFCTFRQPNWRHKLGHCTMVWSATAAGVARIGQARAAERILRAQVPDKIAAMTVTEAVLLAKEHCTAEEALAFAETSGRFADAEMTLPQCMMCIHTAEPVT